MKAVILRKTSVVAVEDCVEPQIQDPGDAIVRVTTAGICGSDLHIVHGRDRGVKMGTIMGHEFVGVLEEAGKDVTGFERGDRVVAPFTVNCGSCFFCDRGLPARCIHAEGFGFITEGGRGLQGAQAEYVRVPMASSTLLRVPEGVPEEAVLFLGDIFSTAYSAAENASIQKGDVVVVVGCGPIGLLSILAAKLYEPSAVVAVDSVQYRLQKARSFGAITVNPEADAIVKIAGGLTGGRGADAVVEAVGSPAALDLAIHAVRPGAVVSIAGYHTESTYALPIQMAYNKNLTVKIGRCNARKYMPVLLPLVLQKRVPITDIITHVLPLTEAVRGYEIFQNHLDGAIKILLKP